MDVRLTCSIMLCYCNVKRKGGFIYDERCYFCVAKAIANYKEWNIVFANPNIFFILGGQNELSEGRQNTANGTISVDTAIRSR